MTESPESRPPSQGAYNPERSQFRSERSGPPRGRGGPGGRRYIRRKRVCQFCAEKMNELDYKNTDLLRRYVSDQGKIRSRRDTGTCSRHQRMVAKTIKRARHMALLPFAPSHVN